MAQFRDSNETHQAPDGELYIALASRPRLVWDMPCTSTAPGTAPIIHTRNNGAHQRWRFEVDHHGTKYTFFRIFNVRSGLALAVQPDGTIAQQPRAEYQQPQGAGSCGPWASPVSPAAPSARPGPPSRTPPARPAPACASSNMNPSTPSPPHPAP
ncbi:RICIN domain-containing protein [Streptomyces sp. NBC_00690]|uniref:RICIN domain-containing protein n=1 Tax=Streptomyces sp. NBC_00690 TaxID=2975808 RepID=UPI002E283456|nr:RICIN domain-containing protein [Streptomyces sp. NBC_00690]